MRKRFFFTHWRASLTLKQVKAAPPPATSIQSLSTTRTPTAQTSFVRGKSSNLPFLPGGLEPSTLALDEDEQSDTEDDLGGWRTRAPGLRRGLRFPDAVDGGKEEDWVIEAFLGRGQGEQVHRPKADTAQVRPSRVSRRGCALLMSSATRLCPLFPPIHFSLRVQQSRLTRSRALTTYCRRRCALLLLASHPLFR